MSDPLVIRRRCECGCHENVLVFVSGRASCCDCPGTGWYWRPNPLMVVRTRD